MPPVFSPLSPSRARLWSIDDTIGTIVLPSVKARTETSGPSRNSSMTTVLPLSPNASPDIIERTAESASSLSAGMTTPLPSASPSALTTKGIGATEAYSSAFSQSEKTS